MSMSSSGADPLLQRASAMPATKRYSHFRVDHSCDGFARGPVHINGIEGFWGMAKVLLVKFKGVPKHTFHLHLEETEWRFNHRASNKVRLLLRHLREKPIC